MNKFKKISDIYVTFLKLGAISFGGGYAILSLIQKEVVEEKKWVEEEEIVDIFGLSGSLPGAIALNSSAFIGFSIAGIPGAVSALLGNLTPSVIIMVVLSVLFSTLSSHPLVQAAFYGIRPAVIALVSYAALKIGKTALKDSYCIVILLAAFTLSMVFQISVVYLVLGGITLGIGISVLQILLNMKKNNREEK